MANECEYHLMAVGKKKASLDRLLSIMRNEDAEFYIYRVFSADVAEDGEEGPPHKAGDFWSMEITGTVAWSCAQWVEDLPQREIKSDDGATYTNLPTLCKMLNVAVEIWAQEEEIGFQQHIVIDNKGAVIKNDEEDYTYIYGYDADSYVSEGGFNDYRIFVNSIEEIWSDTDTLNGSSPAKTPA
ncbi:MAG: hypothetical protein IKU71_06195, partial [Kiritimatiellae bacterium]|nr:hypothetical protein [Kiritimatiellia bacterium]